MSLLTSPSPLHVVSPPLRAASDYRRWQVASVTVAGQRYRMATKPGVFAHGVSDPASLLLAAHVAVSPGDTVVVFNGGNGLVAAAAEMAGHASRVVSSDRNVVSHEAARRTVEANALQHTEVHLAQGIPALSSPVEAQVAAIRIPHDKLSQLQLLRDAFRCLAPGGRCYLSGATNEGVKSIVHTMEQLFGNARVMAQESGHRLVLSVKRPTFAADPSVLAPFSEPLLDATTFHEVQTVLRTRAVTLASRPGVFSWDHADEATELLADMMDVEQGESVLDLGCGSGGLGVVAAHLAGTNHVTMVDADIEAVRSATRTAQLAAVERARVLTSDVASAVRDEQFDVVVTNPPFHVGKATELLVPLQFIEESWEVLAPGGRLFLVANRTLPYELAIRERFGAVTTLHDGPRFKVLGATKAR